MLPGILAVGLLLLVLILSRYGMALGSLGSLGSQESQESQESFLPVPEHTAYVEESQKKLNPLTNLIQLTDPVLPVDPAARSGLYGATHGVDAKGTATEYSLEAKAVFDVPSAVPSALETALGCQKVAGAGAGCSAFDDPAFAENCGMSFDVGGSGSDGKAHVGGMYVAPDDRALQTARAEKVRTEGIPPYDPTMVAQPTLGIAKPGTFALTKAGCVVVKEKVDCEAKQTFGVPNCTQCFTSQRFSRVGPETGTLPFTLWIQGRGGVAIEGGVTLPLKALDEGKAISVVIPAGSEGRTFLMRVVGDGSGGKPPYVAGYIAGPTGRGEFKVDMLTMIQSDLETQARPRMSGTARVNGFRAVSMMPGTGKQGMRLSGMVPFSFVSTHEPDAMACDNGPVVRSEASATFLESDPCYGKKNAVGAYTLECLQSRWLSMGGTIEGTGYPGTAEKAAAIQREGGRGLALDDIMDRLSTRITAAITGKRANGTQMDVPEWNELSMWALGQPITSPCDGLQKDAGPLSQECLTYLYENRGSGGRVGATFSQSATAVASRRGMSSLSGEGFADVGEAEKAATYAYPSAPLDPRTPAGLAVGQTLGGMEAAKQVYDQMVQRATDNTKTNAERAREVKAVYGVTLPPPSAPVVTGPVQVYAVGPDYRHTKAEAAGVCARYGATVATTAQLADAQRAGADWCFSGWVADGGGKWPITTSPIGGCGGRQGVIEWTPDSGKAGVNCYGPKPRPTDVATGVIKPFNGDMWDQPAAGEKTYVTVPSGYLESSGPQPACFDGLSPEEAKKGCDRLGSQCVGFSYSKDGRGSGCYKGNHAAGLNGNAAYMGYVKIPSGGTEPVDGRYLRIEYDRRECLNLAQIMVYSAEGGPNLVTAATKVTKSSGYQGDQFPSGNFVNQKGAQWYNFVHTSCGDVPWVEVDLGSVVRVWKVVLWNRQDCCQERVRGAKLVVLNGEREMVYVSVPIQTVAASYTWYPPAGEAKVNADPMPEADTRRVYGNNGSTSCDQYCRGSSGWPWNGELPRSWNGAQCVGHSSNIPNCYSGFGGGGYCVCQKTGWGWDNRGWRGP